MALITQCGAGRELHAAVTASARTNVIAWWPLDGDALDAATGVLNGTLVGGAAFNGDKPASLTGQSIQFSADPSTGRRSSLSAAPLEDFVAFDGGIRARTAVTFGVSRRF